MTYSYDEIKLGDTVLYRAAKLQNQTEGEDWPAIVYKLYPEEKGDCLGLSVLVEGVPSRYAKVYYSNKPTEMTWRHRLG
jgi:hypothetical protein